MSKPSFDQLFDILAESLSGGPSLPLIAFDDFFPHDDSLRQVLVTFPEDSPKKLAGKSYRVVDLHCQAPSCDCHKVSLAFLEEDRNNHKVWATVSYGWKSTGFYRKWGLDKDMALSLSRGFLDPYAQQSEHSPHFLKIFWCVLKKDPRFIAQLKARYAFLKQALEDDRSLIKVCPPQPEFPENVVPLNSFFPPK